MDEDVKADLLTPYDCLHCHRKAHLPVLTRCGHLYCWRCFHMQTIETSQCSFCGAPVDRQDLFPLFIENEDVQAEEELPDRPAPINVPKILNADIISFNTNYVRDNIAMGRPFAGAVFQPCLALASLNQMGDPEQGEPQKPVTFCLKCIFICLLATLIVAWCLQLTI